LDKVEGTGVGAGLGVDDGADVGADLDKAREAVEEVGLDIDAGGGLFKARDASAGLDVAEGSGLDKVAEGAGVVLGIVEGAGVGVACFVVRALIRVSVVEPITQGKALI
jgi:hypothetical protein